MWDVTGLGLRVRRAALGCGLRLPDAGWRVTIDRVKLCLSLWPLHRFCCHSCNHKDIGRCAGAQRQQTKQNLWPLDGRTASFHTFFSDKVISKWSGLLLLA